MAEISFQRVPVDHDPVLVGFAGDAVAVVLAVGASLGAPVGDDDRDLLQDTLEFLRQSVDRVGNQRLEAFLLVTCRIPAPAFRLP